MRTAKTSRGPETACAVVGLLAIVFLGGCYFLGPEIDGSVALRLELARPRDDGTAEPLDLRLTFFRPADMPYTALELLYMDDVALDALLERSVPMRGLPYLTLQVELGVGTRLPIVAPIIDGLAPGAYKLVADAAYVQELAPGQFVQVGYIGVSPVFEIRKNETTMVGFEILEIIVH